MPVPALNQLPAVCRATRRRPRSVPRRNLSMPGVAVSVGEQIEALERVAGKQTVALIREEHDEEIWSMVQNWPTRFAATRARELGFVVEQSYDEIIRAHIEDELGG